MVDVASAPIDVAVAVLVPRELAVMAAELPVLSVCPHREMPKASLMVVAALASALVPVAVAVLVPVALPLIVPAVPIVMEPESKERPALQSVVVLASAL
jgi:hypothetical protein